MVLYPDLEYGLRFGAGFGSQIALSLVRKWQVTGDRIDGQKFINWIRHLANSNDVVMRILDGKLVSYVDGDSNLHGGVKGAEWPITQAYEGITSESNGQTPSQVEPKQVDVDEEKVEIAQTTTTIAATSDISADQSNVVDTVIEVVVKHTGYPADFVELDQDLEGELGIDTVKQAEIMAEIRSVFGLPVDEDFVLADYPTLNHMIGYINQMTGSSTSVAKSVAAPVAAVVDPIIESPPQAEPPATTSVVSPPSDSSLVETVVEVVVEHTGYPADFIELDQDLEGELGIDTVKQAEIMADIRNRFNLPVDEDFVLADYPTLNHMIAYIQKMTGTESTQPIATPEVVVDATLSEDITQPAPQSIVIPSGNNEEIESQLVEVVVKHTGYPADFIELDQDLEGELGIDTVKQAEIMAEVREIFSLPLDEDFVLSDHPTLNHFTAYIIKMSGGGIAPENDKNQPVVPESTVSAQVDVPIPEAPVMPDVNSSETSEAKGCRRWQVEIEECIGNAEPLDLSGTVVVTDDGWGIAEELCRKLEQHGMGAIRVGFESEIRDMSMQNEAGRTVFRADPANTIHVEQVCNELNNTDICGVIHLAALKLAGVEWDEDTYPSSQISLAAHGWFALLKGLDSKLGALESGIVASVTTLDGRHGNIGELFNSIQSAATGVTKSYSFEQPKLRARALDLHPEIVLDSTHAAELIFNDIFNIGGEVEIGIDRDERRWALVAFDEKLEAEREPLTSTDTWIVSGGGSGVTAASIIGVAQAKC